MATESTGPPVIVVQSGAPNILVRFLYFISVGWWLGGLVSLVAWLFIVLVLTLPVGLWLVNRLPSVVTLRPQGQAWRLEGGVLVRGAAQRSFWLRAPYFLLVGWWLSGLWLLMAYAFILLLVTLPLAFWMYGRVGAVTTLYRS